MLLRNSRIPSSTLALLAAGSLACWVWYSYKTGCTADLKTGTLGNPQLALHYSGIGAIWLITSIISGTLAISLLRGVEHATRLGMATAFFFFGSFAFWLLGGYSETMGVQTCFAP